jgi:hypothetical protein
MKNTTKPTTHLIDFNLLSPAQQKKLDHRKVAAPTKFELSPTYFQICRHTPDVLAKQTDPSKNYSTSYIEAKVVVKIDENTPKDEDGNYIIDLTGSLFKPLPTMPSFVARTGQLLDRRLIDTSKKTATPKPEQADQPF